ncbi:PREDICTED: basic helix-loop-helix [Prunus dulcis]|uniref:PREDICTED: basic helix-loop-helix n=1 Tax=Prunus dulcis TaxID=3755 RepID=A0A5E4EHD2_PRUDU|nr:PREDICTED: basic helix-loop-helix [Prunus dulcis]
MAAPPSSSRLRSMLQASVQSVQWTYSLFWQICPQQGILVWSDGYYNGAIKTRKTVQPMEVSAEEASLQRSQQLRELYDSLSAGETNQPPARRPCASLSPEDLTESEWFYLMCVSFSFPPGVGLPGKAYARRQHVWLTGANEVDSKTFSRAILAKTVVCIPLLDGVVELGTIERDEEEEDQEEDEEAESDSEAETGRNGQPVAPGPNPPAVSAPAAEPSELMQLEMSEDIRLGSPDDASNNLDSDFHLLAVSQSRVNPADQQRQADSYRAESTRRWPSVQEPLSSGLQPPPEGPLALEELTHDDTHYSETVSTILQRQATRWTDSSSTDHVAYSTQSAFIKWTTRVEHHMLVPIEGTSQWLLKYILFSVPFLHTKYRDENSPKSHEGDASTRLRKGTPQDELSANHVMAERRRREKLNERFIILRSLVPFVTKMDKASILGDTIEYVKQLRKKIQDLEARNVPMEDDQRSRSTGEIHRSNSMKELRSGLTVVERTRVGPPGSDKRKLRIVEGSGGAAVAKPKMMEESPPSPPPPPPPPQSSPTPMVTGTSLEVSIIESDGLLELQCPYREGLLLDIMQTLRELRIETTVVQSSLNNGFFVAELRAKVKENVNGKKISITEVKRVINQIIPQSDS